MLRWARALPRWMRLLPGVLGSRSRVLWGGLWLVERRFSLRFEFVLEVRINPKFISSFLNAYYLPSEPPPRNRALAVYAGIDQSVGESAAKATGLARPAGTRVLPGDLTAGWQRCRQSAGGPARANEHGQLVTQPAVAS